jgi:molecular chaperone DnaK (HSP70)
MANKVFGIDLGTTYSCISHVDAYGRPEIISNLDNEPTTPSVVLFDSDDQVVVGKQAKRQARINPDNVASLVKRHMGDSEWRYLVHGKEWSAPAISALILKALAADAQRQLGVDVQDVVITVPAYFGDEERKNTTPVSTWWTSSTSRQRPRSRMDSRRRDQATKRFSSMTSAGAPST